MTRIEANELFDTYGELLTKRQQQILKLSIQEDLSYGEIADELEISRAAVLDAVKQAEKRLVEYEKVVGFCAIRQEVLKTVSGNKELRDRIEEVFDRGGSSL